ncbi:sulfotransferase domain-containing protein [Salinibacter ruber]|uniref:sulfotransferase domain-containing protein n=1 Tax=Salinibacter ruber TaxID=146919 RepID=UPI002073F913|nr:sulfotransferase domain-containing protein [Salinibacter ruber]
MSKHVIIIGAAKSGTSSLFKYLDTHERVNTSAGKEPHYFCDGFYGRYQKKEIPYRNLWSEGNGDIFLEATTSYTKHPVISGTPKNMVEYGISPKIIYIVREPISRLISHVKYMIWRKQNIDVDNLRKVSVASSMYHSQVKRFIDAFGFGAVKLILLDDMAYDPNTCVREIFRFIGIDPVSIEGSRRENKTREVTNIELMVRETPLWNLKSLFPEVLKSHIRSLWATFSKSPEVELIDSIDEERIRIMCEDALRLEKSFNVDLTHWREAIARSSLVPEAEY